MLPKVSPHNYGNFFTVIDYGEGGGTLICNFMIFVQSAIFPNAIWDLGIFTTQSGSWGSVQCNLQFQSAIWAEVTDQSKSHRSFQSHSSVWPSLKASQMP